MVIVGIMVLAVFFALLLHSADDTDSRFYDDEDYTNHYE
jgi:hypothetical protein